MPDPLSRRDFLCYSATAGAIASIVSPLAAGVSTSDVADGQLRADVAPAGWFDQPMRWVQLALVENDPGRFDPKFWLDYFRRLHADAATLSAGGIVAYYPTKVPLHHRSTWLGDSDPFGALVAGCRAIGMHVVARTDPHAARDEVRLAHPDWIAVGEDGQPRRHWANPDLWITCALGPYNFEFMDQVHRESLEAAGGRLLLHALCRELQRRNRARSSTNDRHQGSAATGVRRVAQRTADRAVEAVGCDGARRATGSAVHPERAADAQERR